MLDIASSMDRPRRDAARALGRGGRALAAAALAAALVGCLHLTLPAAECEPAPAPMGGYEIHCDANGVCESPEIAPNHSGGPVCDGDRCWGWGTAW